MGSTKQQQKRWVTSRVQGFRKASERTQGVVSHTAAPVRSQQSIAPAAGPPGPADADSLHAEASARSQPDAAAPTTDQQAALGLVPPVATAADQFAGQAHAATDAQPDLGLCVRGSSLSSTWLDRPQPQAPVQQPQQQQQQQQVGPSTHASSVAGLPAYPPVRLGHGGDPWQDHGSQQQAMQLLSLPQPAAAAGPAALALTPCDQAAAAAAARTQGEPMVVAAAAAAGGSGSPSGPLFLHTASRAAARAAAKAAADAAHSTPPAKSAAGASGTARSPLMSSGHNSSSKRSRAAATSIGGGSFEHPVQAAGAQQSAAAAAGGGVGVQHANAAADGKGGSSELSAPPLSRLEKLQHLKAKRLGQLPLPASTVSAAANKHTHALSSAAAAAATRGGGVKGAAGCTSHPAAAAAAAAGAGPSGSRSVRMSDMVRRFREGPPLPRELRAAPHTTLHTPGAAKQPAAATAAVAARAAAAGGHSSSVGADLAGSLAPIHAAADKTTAPAATAAGDGAADAPWWASEGGAGSQDAAAAAAGSAGSYGLQQLTGAAVYGTGHVLYPDIEVSTGLTGTDSTERDSLDLIGDLDDAAALAAAGDDELADTMGFTDVQQQQQQPTVGLAVGNLTPWTTAGDNNNNSSRQVHRSGFLSSSAVTTQPDGSRAQGVLPLLLHLPAGGTADALSPAVPAPAGRVSSAMGPHVQQTVGAGAGFSGRAAGVGDGSRSSSSSQADATAALLERCRRLLANSPARAGGQPAQAGPVLEQQQQQHSGQQMGFSSTWRQQLRRLLEEFGSPAAQQQVAQNQHHHHQQQQQQLLPGLSPVKHNTQQDLLAQWRVQQQQQQVSPVKLAPAAAAAFPSTTTAAAAVTRALSPIKQLQLQLEQQGPAQQHMLPGSAARTPVQQQVHNAQLLLPDLPSIQGWRQVLAAQADSMSHYASSSSSPSKQPGLVPAAAAATGRHRSLLAGTAAAAAGSTPPDVLLQNWRARLRAAAALAGVDLQQAHTAATAAAAAATPASASAAAQVLPPAGRVADRDEAPAAPPAAAVVAVAVATAGSAAAEAPPEAAEAGAAVVTQVPPEAAAEPVTAGVEVTRLTAGGIISATASSPTSSNSSRGSPAAAYCAAATDAAVPDAPLTAAAHVTSLEDATSMDAGGCTAMVAQPGHEPDSSSSSKQLVSVLPSELQHELQEWLVSLPGPVRESVLQHTRASAVCGVSVVSVDDLLLQTVQVVAAADTAGASGADTAVTGVGDSSTDGDDGEPGAAGAVNSSSQITAAGGGEQLLPGPVQCTESFAGAAAGVATEAAAADEEPMIVSVTAAAAAAAAAAGGACDPTAVSPECESSPAEGEAGVSQAAAAAAAGPNSSLERTPATCSSSDSKQDSITHQDCGSGAISLRGQVSSHVYHPHHTARRKLQLDDAPMAAAVTQLPAAAAVRETSSSTTTSSSSSSSSDHAGQQQLLPSQAGLGPGLWPDAAGVDAVQEGSSGGAVSSAAGGRDDNPEGQPVATAPAAAGEGSATTSTAVCSSPELQQKLPGSAVEGPGLLHDQQGAAEDINAAPVTGSSSGSSSSSTTQGTTQSGDESPASAAASGDAQQQQQQQQQCEQEVCPVGSRASAAGSSSSDGAAGTVDSCSAGGVQGTVCPARGVLRFSKTPQETAGSSPQGAATTTAAATAEAAPRKPPAGKLPPQPQQQQQSQATTVVVASSVEEAVADGGFCNSSSSLGSSDRDNSHGAGEASPAQLLQESGSSTDPVAAAAAAAPHAAAAAAAVHTVPSGRYSSRCPPLHTPATVVLQAPHPAAARSQASMDEPVQQQQQQSAAEPHQQLGSPPGCSTEGEEGDQGTSSSSADAACAAPVQQEQQGQFELLPQQQPELQDPSPNHQYSTGPDKQEPAAVGTSPPSSSSGSGSSSSRVGVLQLPPSGRGRRAPLAQLSCPASYSPQGSSSPRSPWGAVGPGSGASTPPAMVMLQQGLTGFSPESAGLKGLLGSAVAGALFDRTPEGSPAPSPEGKLVGRRAVVGCGGGSPVGDAVRATAPVMDEVEAAVAAVAAAAAEADQQGLQGGGDDLQHGPVQVEQSVLSAEPIQDDGMS